MTTLQVEGTKDDPAGLIAKLVQAIDEALKKQ